MVLFGIRRAFAADSNFTIFPPQINWRWRDIVNNSLVRVEFDEFRNQLADLVIVKY